MGVGRESLGTRDIAVQRQEIILMFHLWKIRIVVSLFLGTSQEMEERFRGKGAKETSRK
jgi:hypothetical protein